MAILLTLHNSCARFESLFFCLFAPSKELYLEASQGVDAVSRNPRGSDLDEVGNIVVASVVTMSKTDLRLSSKSWATGLEN